MKQQTNPSPNQSSKLKRQRMMGLNDGKMLLLCDGRSKIVFAHGDATIFNCSLSDLKHKNLFSLGFSQKSLTKVARQAQGGLFEALERHKTFTLEIVKSLYPTTQQYFQKNSFMFMKRVILDCSLVRVKFGNSAIMQKQCKIVREPVTLQNRNNKQTLLVLVQVLEMPILGKSQTSYSDYCRTLEKLKLVTSECKAEEPQFIQLEKQEEPVMVKIEQE